MAAAEAASAGSGDAGGDADALKAKLQELLEETQKAERLLRDQEKEHDALMAATAAAEEARESLNSALLTPLCQAQASVSKMMKEVSTLDRAPIDEVRQLQTPPKAVVRSMAMVHGILFGREAKAAAPEWKELQKMMRREDFLGRVRGFRIQGSALVNAAVASRLRTDIEGKSRLTCGACAACNEVVFEIVFGGLAVMTKFLRCLLLLLLLPGLAKTNV
eukprot:TRINITY_DN15389_c0_g2_i1.p1 TRINITY_DN15389_c0_g2~~TRINITY_DN15389_c0_g2_i1.p1  ORF type:complete len:219 (-),score=76.66 TRINITY_DN15389_c0_g2_i1:2-658(-)